MKSNVLNIYDNMEFPPYEYREYPKWVGDVLVENADEEAAATAGSPVVREADEKARLVKVAEIFGVQVDKRWSPEKLAKAISDAGHDPAHDPEA